SVQVVDRHALAFARRPVAMRRDSAVVHEDVVAIFAGDESEALLIAAPLVGALCHPGPPARGANADTPAPDSARRGAYHTRKLPGKRTCGPPLTFGQGTILAIGSSMMSVAPRSFSCGIKTFI